MKIKTKLVSKLKFYSYLSVFSVNEHEFKNRVIKTQLEKSFILIQKCLKTH